MEEYVIVNNKLLHLESEYGYVESLLHTPRAMIRFIVENPDLQQERVSILPIIIDLLDSSHDSNGIFSIQTNRTNEKLYWYIRKTNVIRLVH